MASLPLLSFSENNNEEEEIDRDESLHGLTSLDALLAAAESVAFHTKSLRKLLHNLHPIMHIRFPHKMSQGQRHGVKLDIDMSEVAIRATSVKIGLEAMEKELSEHQCFDPRSCDMVKVRDFVVESVRKDLCVFVEEVKVLRHQMWETQCDDLRRRLFSVTGEIASEEAVRSMLEIGERHGFLSGKSLKGGERSYSEVMQEIEDRRGFVKKTGESFNALEDMLVRMVQEMTVFFELHVPDTIMKKHVREAMANFMRIKDEDDECSDVDSAMATESSWRRGRCFLLLIVLLAFVFIIVPVVILLLLL